MKIVTKLFFRLWWQILSTYCLPTFSRVLPPSFGSLGVANHCVQLICPNLSVNQTTCISSPISQSIGLKWSELCVWSLTLYDRDFLCWVKCLANHNWIAYTLTWATAIRLSIFFIPKSFRIFPFHIDERTFFFTLVETLETRQSLVWIECFLTSWYQIVSRRKTIVSRLINFNYLLTTETNQTFSSLAKKATCILR